jgi:hypothetical protein
VPHRTLRIEGFRYRAGRTVLGSLVAIRRPGCRATATPDLGDATIGHGLNAVGASSAGNVWAVGSYYNGTVNQALAIHCC